MIYLDADNKVTTRKLAYFAKDKKNPDKNYVRAKYRIWYPWIFGIPGGFVVTLKCFEFGTRFVRFELIPSDGLHSFWGQKLNGKLLVNLVDE